MASTVTAEWTATHARDIAKPTPMLVTGIISDSVLTNNSPEYPIPIPKDEAEESDKSWYALGSCFCGQVQLELPLGLKPAISVVCHCADCRQWHSVGSVPYMMFPLHEIRARYQSRFVCLPLKVHLLDH